MKLHSSELPGPLPTMFDEAMAILACATCASLSRSTSLGVICLWLMNLSIRAFHVSNRWNTFSTTDLSSGSFLAVICSVSCLPGCSSELSLPNVMIMPTSNATARSTTPISLPNCRMGTRPISIIMNMTMHSSIAVERFSSMMSGTIRAQTLSMKLKALGSAPLSVCITLSICAVASTSEPLANSDGWNCIPKIGIHRCAPLVDAPMK